MHTDDGDLTSLLYYLEEGNYIEVAAGKYVSKGA
jgi:hypothetical protein